MRIVCSKCLRVVRDSYTEQPPLCMEHCKTYKGLVDSNKTQLDREYIDLLHDIALAQNVGNDPFKEEECVHCGDMYIRYWEYRHEFHRVGLCIDAKEVCGG